MKFAELKQEEIYSVIYSESEYILKFKGRYLPLYEQGDVF